MSQLWGRLKELSGKLLRTGFFSVFLANILSKVLTFIGGMIIFRILTKSENGVYTYVINCYGILMLLGDLGCSQATLQFCNESHNDPKRFNGYFIYGVHRGFAFSTLTSLLILASPWFYPFKTAEAAQLTRMLCLMPFLSTANSLLASNLRARLKNHHFGAVNIFRTFVHYLVILPMSYWMGAVGAVLSNYVVESLVLVFGLLASRGLLDFSWRNDSLTKAEKRGFLNLAFGSQLDLGIAQAMMMLDVFLIGIFIYNDEIIASYKAATVIPSALSFIPTSLIVYVGPYFVHHNQDLDWVRLNYFRLTLGCLVGSILIAGGCILLAPWIIPLIFGRQYADAVPCFIVLMLGYIFSAAIQVPSQNIIYMQRKVKVNIAITVFTGAANCVLDVVLILKSGSIGAAWATTLVHVIASALCFSYMCFYLRRKSA